MTKIMYVASLNTKKYKYDGERIKSTLIFESLQKIYSKIDVINLSKSKVFMTLKLILLCMFKKRKYNYFIVSKDPRGGKILHVNQDKIIYFEIGPFLYNMLRNNKVEPTLFSKNKHVIVETNSMKNELESFGFNNVLVFPNFKKKPDIIFEPKTYPVKTLNLVYFSRIEEQKGVYELISAIKKINNLEIRYTLDIYGMLMSGEDKELLNNLIQGREDIHYKGTLDTSSLDSYQQLSKYDLHVFPTWYDEGFPGTLIDFFFIGIPTVSSSFLRSKDILTTNDSFIYLQHNENDLIKTLDFIYDNQEQISQKAIYTKQLGERFTSFDDFLKELLNAK